MVLYEFGSFRLDAKRLLLYVDGAPAALGPKVVETLLALLEHPGEIISKRALIERIWPTGYIEEANLAQNVYVLRKLLREHDCEVAIETISRRGYRFTKPVRHSRAAAAPEPQRAFVRAAIVAAVASILFGIAAGAFALSRERPAAPLSAEARLYAIGSFYLSVRTRFAMPRSIVFFTRAITIDPSSARDYAGRAEAYELLADYGYGSAAPARGRDLSREDVDRALALDPRCAHAYAVLGLQALDALRVSRALRTLSTAIALDPNDADAHEWYAVALLSEKRIGDAESQLETAQGLNPLSIATTSWLASVAYLQGRYDDAVAEARQGLAVAPSRKDLWIVLGLAQEAQGKYIAAMASFSRYSTSCAGCRAEAAALRSYAYARLGRLGAARLELAVARSGGARPEDLALALAAAGQRAGLALKRAGAVTADDRVLLANDPRFGRLSTGELRLLEDGQG